mmetsp:Transcript_655/g.1124  ORF Transcript_655/g.1124 Transcript_655/m.1124 type:complete len:595 (+) Transcript_655:251-2035(+)|eukprot:CAMPEP_0184673736 /NCGR_PEP_ID=MMETSP0308-20130426/86843_1 /TAXON_ID=38269 /ORGANISM="Gloeochaete witrockiana, Strain SAG 46.84" /LENGTH=594 /DNA_ID=CAMNT_0027121255 /DNA_START=151 /DNA_END=1935 /DNA_ORIENTATION=+
MLPSNGGGQGALRDAAVKRPTPFRLGNGAGWQVRVNLSIQPAQPVGVSPHRDARLAWLPVQVKGNGPAARTLHTACAVGENVYIFGGWDGVEYFDDLYALNVGTMEWWKPASASPPPTARIGHTATAVGSRIFVFGGHNDTKWFNDLYVLDTDTASGGNSKMQIQWSRPPVKGWAPPARRGHTATAIGDKIYVFAGYNYNARTCCSKHFSDVYVLDTTTMTWDEVRTTCAPGTLPPAGRWNHAAAAVGTKLYIFGGSQSNTHYNDLYVLDTETLQWDRPVCTGNPPSERGHHSCLSLGQYLVVFGGFDGETNRHYDLHVLDTVTMYWWAPTVTGKPPAPRSSHTAAFVGTTMIIHGGYGGWINYFDDVCMVDASSLILPTSESRTSSRVMSRHASISLPPGTNLGLLPSDLVPRPLPALPLPIQQPLLLPSDLSADVHSSLFTMGTDSTVAAQLLMRQLMPEMTTTPAAPPPTLSNPPRSRPPNINNTTTNTGWTGELISSTAALGMADTLANANTALYRGTSSFTDPDPTSPKQGSGSRSPTAGGVEGREMAAKTFTFDDQRQALAFLTKLSELADQIYSGDQSSLSLYQTSE